MKNKTSKFHLFVQQNFPFVRCYLPCLHTLASSKCHTIKIYIFVYFFVLLPTQSMCVSTTAHKGEMLNESTQFPNANGSQLTQVVVSVLCVPYENYPTTVNKSECAICSRQKKIGPKTSTNCYGMCVSARMCACLPTMVTDVIAQNLCSTSRTAHNRKSSAQNIFIVCCDTSTYRGARTHTAASPHHI